jgi:hypothetical protein
MFEAGQKWSLRRTRGEGKTTLSQREDHVQLAQIARELQPDVIVTTANFPHYIRGVAGRRAPGRRAAARQAGADVPRHLQQEQQVQAVHGELRFAALVGERDKQRFERLRVLDRTRYK